MRAWAFPELSRLSRVSARTKSAGALMVMVSMPGLA